MKGLFRTVAGILVALVASGASGVELEVVGGGGRHAGFATMMNPVASEPSEVLVDEPEYAGRNVQYITLTIGNGKDAKITAALDESLGTGTGYDTLYVDANNNNDLTDDAAVKPTVSERGLQRSLRVNSLEVTAKYADGTSRELPVCLRMEGHSFPGYGAPISWSVDCRLDGHLQGYVDFGSRTNVLIAVYDAGRDYGTGNAAFDDFCLDRIGIDVNGDGSLSEREEDFALSKVIAFEGALWEIDTDSAGRKFTVKPCSLPTGTIALERAFSEDAALVDGRVDVLSSRGYALSCEIGEEEGFAVPAGPYRVSGGYVVLKDADGAEWEAIFAGGETVVVRQGEQQFLDLGLPPELRPQIYGVKRPGGHVVVSCSFAGSGDEECMSIGPKDRRNPPSVRIIDAEGIVVDDGKMEYG